MRTMKPLRRAALAAAGVAFRRCQRLLVKALIERSGRAVPGDPEICGVLGE